MNKPKYWFQPGEAGTLVEIYLPSKYHSVLLHILERALDFDHVAKSFPKVLDDGPVSMALRRLLPEWIEDRYGEVLNALASSNGVCFGFSVFNVDGAFSVPADKAKPMSVVREEVTVARIILRPDFSSLYTRYSAAQKKRAHTLTKWYFNSGLRSSDVPRDMVWRSDDSIGETDIQILNSLGIWQNYTALFVYGFIVRRITEIPEIDEQEIWVTSYHNPVVNVVQKIE